MANKRKWYDTKKEAIKARDEINKFRTGSVEVHKKKFGRNKGRFYLGSYIEFINLND